MPLAEIRGIQICFERGGQGPPVLLISGTGGDLRHKPSVFSGALPEHFELLAYDQRGLGRSGKPDGPYTMADYADDAAALLARRRRELSDLSAQAEAQGRCNLLSVRSLIGFFAGTRWLRVPLSRSTNYTTRWPWAGPRRRALLL